MHYFMHKFNEMGSSPRMVDKKLSFQLDIFLEKCIKVLQGERLPQSRLEVDQVDLWLSKTHAFNSHETQPNCYVFSVCCTAGLALIAFVITIKVAFGKVFCHHETAEPCLNYEMFVLMRCHDTLVTHCFDSKNSEPQSKLP